MNHAMLQKKSATLRTRDIALTSFVPLRDEEMTHQPCAQKTMPKMEMDGGSKTRGRACPCPPKKRSMSKMSKMSLVQIRDKIKKDAGIKGFEDTMKIIFQVFHLATPLTCELVSFIP